MTLWESFIGVTAILAVILMILYCIPLLIVLGAVLVWIYCAERRQERKAENSNPSP